MSVGVMKDYLFWKCLLLINKEKTKQLFCGDSNFFLETIPQKKFKTLCSLCTKSGTWWETWETADFTGVTRVAVVSDTAGDVRCLRWRPCSGRTVDWLEDRSSVDGSRQYTTPPTGDGVVLLVCHCDWCVKGYPCCIIVHGYPVRRVLWSRIKIRD
jgi:hypothetical protein